MSEVLTNIDEPILISSAVGNIEIKRVNGSVQTKIISLFEDVHAGLSYSTDKVLHKGKLYELYSPIRCKFSQEADYFLIESEQLGIVGTGKTVQDAENNFAEEFDYIYNRYNQLPDHQLSEKIKRIKKVLNAIILKVSD